MTKVNMTSKLVMMVTVALLSGCADNPVEKYPSGYDRTETHEDIYAPRDTVWKNGSPINKVLNEHRMQHEQTGPRVNQ